MVGKLLVAAVKGAGKEAIGKLGTSGLVVVVNPFTPFGRNNNKLRDGSNVLCQATGLEPSRSKTNLAIAGDF